MGMKKVQQYQIIVRLKLLKLLVAGEKESARVREAVGYVPLFRYN